MGNKSKIKGPFTRKDYFNEHEFNKIQDLIETNPKRALELYEEYFKQYPNDHAAYNYYATLLISLKRYEEAEKILNKVKYELENNPLYSKNETRKYFLKFNLLYSKLKLLMFQNKWEEALSFYEKYENIFDGVFNAGIKLYIEKRLGLAKPINNRYEESYSLRQIREYSEDDFRCHMRKHEQDYNENNKLISNAYFSYDFPMDKVIEEVKKHIPSDKRYQMGFYEDNYIFKYIGCGRYDDKIVDYFKVITFKDTTDIITMTPVSEQFDDLEQVVCDLTELSNNKKEQKVLSGIDRFNKRYNRS